MDIKEREKSFFDQVVDDRHGFWECRTSVKCSTCVSRTSEPERSGRFGMGTHYSINHEERGGSNKLKMGRVAA